MNMVCSIIHQGLLLVTMRHITTIKCFENFVRDWDQVEVCLSSSPRANGQEKAANRLSCVIFRISLMERRENGTKKSQVSYDPT